MPLEQEQVLEWLTRAHLEATRGSAPNAEYSIDVVLPNQLKVTVVQPAGGHPTLAIAAGLAIPDDDRRAIQSADDFDWTLRTGLIQLGLGVSVTVPTAGEPASLVQLQVNLFDEIPTPGQVMDAIQRVTNGLVYTIITVNRFKGKEAHHAEAGLKD